MKGISGLKKSLTGYLGWDKRRIECFSQMLLGLFAVRTVNLQELAISFASEAKVGSRYRRIQRFFAQFEIDYVKLARWVYKLFVKEGAKVYVIIDRTNWYIGKKKVNIFLLAVGYEGLAIPLFWRLLDKAGNSNFAEQKGLIGAFIEVFGSGCIAGLLADREFGSGALFKWLNSQRIPFYIRIKEGSMGCIRKKKYLTVKKLFRHLKVREQMTFGMGLWVYGQPVYLTGSRSERGELMIVASNQPDKQAVSVYLRRWEIESLFQSLKGRGFRFEETHLTQPERIKKLMGVLAIGFAWAHKVGEWLAVKKPILFKQHKQQQRPQYSYFRYGFDFIRAWLFNPYAKTAQFSFCCKLLIPSSLSLEGTS